MSSLRKFPFAPTFVVLLSGLFATCARAQDSAFPIVTDRPSFSDGTLIVPKGHWQIESGYTFYRADQAENQTLGELLFRLPLSDRIELRLINVTFDRANIAGGAGSGFLDPTVGFKYKLHNSVQGKSPDLAFGLQTTVPVGNRDFRVDRYQPTLKFIGYYQIDDVNGVVWNVVWSDLGTDPNKFSQWAGSVYYARTLSPKTSVYAETYALLPVAQGGSNSAFADVGVAYLLNKATQVDFRVGSGFNQVRDGWFIGAGVSYRF